MLLREQKALLDIETQMFKYRRLREVATIWSRKQNKLQTLGEEKKNTQDESGQRSLVVER